MDIYFYDSDSSSDSDESEVDLAEDLELSDSDSSESTDSGNDTDLSLPDDLDDEPEVPINPFETDPLSIHRPGLLELSQAADCRWNWLERGYCPACRDGLHTFDTRTLPTIDSRHGLLHPNCGDSTGIHNGFYFQLHTPTGDLDRYRRVMYYYPEEAWTWEVLYDCGDFDYPPKIIQQTYRFQVTNNLPQDLLDLLN